MKHETITNTTKSLDSIRHRFVTDAPKTFLIPISFVRCSATKDERPRSPRQLIKIASEPKNDASFPIRSSAANFFAYSSSTNVYSNGADGITDLKTDSIFAIALDALTPFLMRMLIQLTLPLCPFK